MNWKVVFGYGLALLLAGTIIGFVEGGFDRIDVFAIGYTVHLVSYFLIFVVLAYRHTQRPLAHAALAAVAETAFATAILGAINYFLPIPPSETIVLTIVEWVIKLVALLTGVPTGIALRHYLSSRRSRGSA